MRANQRSLKNLKKRNVELQGQNNLLEEQLMILFTAIFKPSSEISPLF